VTPAAPTPPTGRPRLFGRAHSIEAAGLLGAILVAAVFLVWGTHMGRAGQGGADPAWPAGSGSLVVWRSADGALTARVTDASGTATDTSLGAGNDVRLVAGGARPVVLVDGADGGHRLLRYVPARHAWSTLATSLHPGELTSAAVVAGLAYLPVGAGKGAAVIAVRPDGAVVARYALPVLEPDPNALLAQPGQAAGAGTRAAGRGRVAALLAVPGDVLAVTATPFAAAVTDLRTGARVSLGSYTRIVAATVGGDGFVYLLAGSADPAFTLRFLRIDPRTMRSLAAWDTGVAASSQTAWALPTRFGAIVYSPGTPHSIDAYLGTNVWLLDGGGARTNSAVSSNAGVRMGPGAGDSVLLYGTPAGGAVSRLDTDDGVLSRASARLAAPPGSTVLLAAD
jgi:hypothetical protein